MQPDFYEIKAVAKKNLKSRWPEAIAAIAILISVACLDTLFQSSLMTIFKVDAVWSPFSPTNLPSYSIAAGVAITLLSAIYNLVVVFPLSFGVLRWFWNLSSASTHNVTEIFYYFGRSKELFKAVAIALGLFIRMILGAIVCFLPGIILYYLTVPDIYNAFGFAMPFWLESLNPLVSVFETLGLLLFVFWIIRYILFYVVLFSEPESSAYATISKGAKLSGRQALRLFGFLFSFAGWLLLCILVVPIIFVGPYIFSSFAVYGREEYRASKEDLTGKINF